MNQYTFEAIRGTQARTSYYVVMVPLKVVPRLFVFDDEGLPADMRAQRILSRSRVPQIASYLAENWEDYIFSSLCASIDGELTFEAAGENGEQSNVGRLHIPLEARILLNDGQHRRAAIEEALKTRPELENETISVVIFADRGLARSQQMFADLNKNAVRPSGSLSVLFDHRNPLAQLSSRVFETVPFFHRVLELEKTTLSNRTTKLYTLSSLNKAHEWMVGPDAERFDGDTEAKAVSFWHALYEVMDDWRRLDAGVQSAQDLRENTVHAHGVMLQAFGLLGGTLLASHPDDWAELVLLLKGMDWSRRRGDLWEGRVMNGGRMNGQSRSVLLGAAVLYKSLGLKLDDRMQTAEKTLLEVPNAAKQTVAAVQ